MSEIDATLFLVLVTVGTVVVVTVGAVVGTALGILTKIWWT